jgi:hypothetical protein
MKELEQITDYQQEALEVLLTQYEDSIYLRGLISGKSYQADDIEQALFEIRDLFYLDTATGTQLNVIGKIWNVNRSGRNDEDYREAIYFQISLKISGTIPEIRAILKAFYGATYILYAPQYPAKYLLLTDANISIADLERISPAGVGVIIRRENDIDNKVFGFRAPGDDSRFAITKDLKFLKAYED